MKVTMLRSPAASFGCELIEGQTGTVDDRIGRRLVAAGVAVEIPEPKPVKAAPAEPAIKAVPPKPAIAEPKPSPVKAEEKEAASEAEKPKTPHATRSGRKPKTNKGYQS